jgi:cytosine/adenosine deaminase-related metal-dependent hydrolase
MDLILRNARIATAADRLTDIGIVGGKIVALEPHLAAEAEELDVAGRLVSPGFVETHLHLDKACILERCRAERGDLDEAIREVARVKAGFTAEDVYARAKRTVERCILNGTTHIRTHLEVDPGIGLRGLEGVLPLVGEYAWAVDIEICVFPQEGLLNNPGTEDLMVAALKQGGALIGACPYTDSDPHGQIDRIFALARAFDLDIDMHLDFDLDPAEMDRGVRTRRARRGRPRDQALGARPGRARRGGVAVALGGRRAHGAAVDRSLSDGAQRAAARRAWRDAGAPSGEKRRQLLARDQQCAQSVHAVRRLLAAADRQPLCERVPDRVCG